VVSPVLLVVKSTVAYDSNDSVTDNWENNRSRDLRSLLIVMTVWKKNEKIVNEGVEQTK